MGSFLWNLFNQDHFLGRVLSRIFDLILLNVVYLVFCIPLVTIGSASSALYYTTVRMAEGTDVRPLRDFLKGFRENFKAITPIWLVILAYSILLGTVFGLNQQRMWGGDHVGWMYIILITLIVLVILFCEWLFVLQMRFENTRRELIKNAMLFLVRFLPSLLLIDTGHIALLLLALSAPPLYPITIIFGFSLPALLKGYYFSHIFSKVMVELKADGESTVAPPNRKENSFPASNVEE